MRTMSSLRKTYEPEKKNPYGMHGGLPPLQSLSRSQPATWLP